VETKADRKEPRHTMVACPTSNCDISAHHPIPGKQSLYWATIHLFLIPSTHTPAQLAHRNYGQKLIFYFHLTRFFLAAEKQGKAPPATNIRCFELSSPQSLPTHPKPTKPLKSSNMKA
jgi:hypothetical protein